jgi:hypothetical protein
MVHQPRQRLSRQETFMGMTTSDQILHRLQQWGVRRIYGYPGDGITAGGRRH